MKPIARPTEADVAAAYPIETQTSQNDRIVLVMLRELAARIAAAENPILRRLRRPDGKLAYLELGSYLGGTLAQYLTDERFGAVVSVDKRVSRQWDERNSYFEYEGVTTRQMVEGLRSAMDPILLGKLTTFDGGGRDFAVSPEAKRHLGRCEVIMIDAEHTHSAVFDDFVTLFPFLRRDGLVLFHDAPILVQGLRNIVRHLEDRKVSFTTRNLKDNVYAIGVNKSGPALAAADFGELEWDEDAFLEHSRRFVIDQTIRLNIDEARRIVAEQRETPVTAFHSIRSERESRP